MESQYDVVIVGARCAGAGTALLLARAGARVLVVDKGSYGTDTLSTHALMRGAVLQLGRWGVLPTIVAAGTPPVRSATFHYMTNSVTIAIEPRLGVDALFAPRRWLLDRALADAAVASGATFEYGVKLVEVTRGKDDRVNGVILRREAGGHRAVRARLVIGADGLYSTVASSVGAPDVRRGEHATAVLYAYWPGAPFDGYQWFYRPDVSVGAIPTNGAACVFVALPRQEFRKSIGGDVHAAYHRLLAKAAPAFYDTLGDPRGVEQVRGFGGHTSFMRACQGPGWALVGDAGYFKDPLTAHGITDALRDAEILARAALDDTPAAFAQYERTRDELSNTLFDVTDQLASFQWDNDRLQRLHRSLSQEMSREARALADLEPLTCLSPLANEQPVV